MSKSLFLHAEPIADEGFSSINIFCIVFCLRAQPNKRPINGKILPVHILTRRYICKKTKTAHAMPPVIDTSHTLIAVLSFTMLLFHMNWKVVI